MTRKPINLKGLFKAVGSKKSAELTYPPPPRWDDREDAPVVLAAAPAKVRAPRSLSLGGRRPIAVPHRAA